MAETVKLEDWLKEQRKDWRFRFWEIVLGPAFWFAKKKIEHGIDRRHRYERQPSWGIALADEPHESLWRLAKYVLVYAVCEEGDCLDCDLLRDVAREALRIKEQCREDSDGLV
jgi:hypothetical protein